MKIISLQAENVKRLRAVEIKPDGALVQITGRNGAGKSSVIDSIFYALAGGKDLPSQPIRKGEAKAVVRLDLGEIIVTRKFTPTGSTLVVEGANGARISSPQRMLNDLIGAISFDPLAFSRMGPEQQYEMLRQVVKLDVDIDALAGKNKTDYEARTDENREAKALRTQAAAIAVPDGLPANPIDVAALMDRMAEASKHNSDIETRRSARESAAATITRNRARISELAGGIAEGVASVNRRRDEMIADLRRQIAALEARIIKATEDAEREIADSKARIEAEIATLNSEADGLQKRLDDAPALADPIDIVALRADIDRAGRDNAGIEARERRAKIEAEAAKAEAASAALTAAMKARDEERQGAIERAVMPVDGLSFGDGEILYRGIPFAQASSAEQLRVSVGIAMAANPKLRVMLVKDGSLLDPDGLRMLRDLVEAADMQVWMEKVDATGKIGVVIEDGAVVAVNADEREGEPAHPLLAMGA